MTIKTSRTASNEKCQFCAAKAAYHTQAVYGPGEVTKAIPHCQAHRTDARTKTAESLEN